MKRWLTAYNKLFILYQIDPTQGLWFINLLIWSLNQNLKVNFDVNLA